MNRVVAKAHSNIALIKYWGKKDEDLIIPYNSSISMTLDALYTITEAEFIEDDKDVYVLNGVLQDEENTGKLSTYLDLFRRKAGNFKRIKIDSKNHFPTAAGLASSASGFAALATALDRLLGLNMDKKDLSKMARLGSGSASRSIFGGLVEWKAGYDHESSYAEKILDEDEWDLAMLVALIDSGQKEISSRKAMKDTVETSPYYPAWVTSSEEDLELMKKAIGDKDFNLLGQTAERSALKMHASMLAASPSTIYFKPKSLEVIEEVRNLRKRGMSLYFTMDAGPNVKIICRQADMDKLEKIINDDLGLNTIASKIGGDARIIDEED